MAVKQQRVDAQDFLNPVGVKSYDGPEHFEAEAKAQGICRRVGGIPAGMRPGQSRIYLPFGGGKDSAPRKCVRCAGALPKFSRDEDGAPFVECPACGEHHDGRRRALGRIPFYFVPTLIEVVALATPAATRTLISRALGLRLLRARDIEDYDRTLRASLPVRADSLDTVLRQLREGRVVLDRAAVEPLLRPGGFVTLVGEEPRRGRAGYRQHGGLYLRGEALVPIRVPITFDSPHFRGIATLSRVEQQAAAAHVMAGAEAEPLALPFPRVAGRRAA